MIWIEQINPLRRFLVSMDDVESIAVVIAATEPDSRVARVLSDAA